MNNCNEWETGKKPYLGKYKEIVISIMSPAVHLHHVQFWTWKLSDASFCWIYVPKSEILKSFQILSNAHLLVPVFNFTTFIAFATELWPNTQAYGLVICAPFMFS